MWNYLNGEIKKGNRLRAKGLEQMSDARSQRTEIGRQTREIR
jgi:hypothetical protein